MPRVDGYSNRKAANSNVAVATWAAMMRTVSSALSAARSVLSAARSAFVASESSATATVSTIARAAAVSTPAASKRSTAAAVSIVYAMSRIVPVPAQTARMAAGRAPTRHRRQALIRPLRVRRQHPRADGAPPGYRRHHPQPVGPRVHRAAPGFYFGGANGDGLTAPVKQGRPHLLRPLPARLVHQLPERHHRGWPRRRAGRRGGHPSLASVRKSLNVGR